MHFNFIFVNMSIDFKESKSVVWTGGNNKNINTLRVHDPKNFKKMTLAYLILWVGVETEIKEGQD